MFVTCDTELSEATVKPLRFPSSTFLAVLMFVNTPLDARTMCTFQPVGAGGPPGTASNPTPPVPDVHPLSSNPSPHQVFPNAPFAGTVTFSGAVGPTND